MFMPASASVYEYDKNGNPVLDQNGNQLFGGTVPLWAKDLGVAGTFGEVVHLNGPAESVIFPHFSGLDTSASRFGSHCGSVVLPGLQLKTGQTPFTSSTNEVIQQSHVMTIT